MKVALVLDGEAREVDVDLAAGRASLGDRSFPVTVTSQGPSRIELDIAGEKVVVEGWLVTVPSPADGVTVNGERHRIEAHVSEGPRSAPAALPSPSAAPAPPAGGPGLAVRPPMPGRIVELRVKDGDPVTRGQVLLVLEAMKMRNEVLSPANGRIAELSVAPGANVRAGESMLRVVPD
jgi:glutaconyl-CoA/methylmalonyl-CoA decarboxylase subunit gamma